MTAEAQIERTFREEHGRVLAALIGQLEFRAGRGCAARRAGQCAGTLGGRRRPAQPRRVVDDRRPAARHRPPAPRGDAERKAAILDPPISQDEPRWTTTRFPTTA